MVFDLSTAKQAKVESKSKTDDKKSKFDLSTARPVDKVSDLGKPQAQQTGSSSLVQRILSNLTSKKTEPIGGIANRISGAMVNPMGNIPSIAMSAAGIPEENAAP